MTVILSDETLKQLLEAHASMAAWYYQMAEVLRTANLGVNPPTEEQRRAYIQQLASHFPEIAAVASAIQAPRPYVPPPAIAAPAVVTENEGVSTPPPPKDLIDTPAMVRNEAETAPTPGAPTPGAPTPGAPPPSATPPAEGAAQSDSSVAPPAMVAPPAIVKPDAVKYE